MVQSILKNSISKASKVVGNTWPLYSFVTSNQLSGYEAMPFKTAVGHAARYLDANVYPKASTFESAWRSSKIDKRILEELLKEQGYHESPEYYLNFMTSDSTATSNKEVDLDRIVSKWLGAFLDEGISEWVMPYKKLGFFKAWKQLAKHDGELRHLFKNKISDSSEETLATLLSQYTEDEVSTICTHHLAALPGWVGYIKQRVETNTEWNQEFPIDLSDYLAVRLLIAEHLGVTVYDESWKTSQIDETLEVKHLFLRAWETTWQRKMVTDLQTKASDTSNDSPSSIDAQMVFCIDTRSELIRRHVESKGPYETFGYAGFFGIATVYQDLETGISRKSCPPIVPSSYKTQESPLANKTEELTAFHKKRDFKKFKLYLLRRLKNMLPSAFGFVEGTGIFYGVSMLKRTLLAGKFRNLELQQASDVERICEPEVHKIHDENHRGIPLSEKVGIVKSAFDLLGWTRFAPLVLFVGHGSHSTNNPFASSLDCGACAASPGRHNARLLAKLANDPKVRTVLVQEYNIRIPENTIFIGAEHNTTTDEITLFDAHVTSQHQRAVNQLKRRLKEARESAANERLKLQSNGINKALIKSNNWSETRPEWGLAKNAGFVVGSRQLTKDLNMDGTCFLHSYDWRKDSEGNSLEGIMQGPMVVTQWINNHYYFSTVDNKKFGGGDKISHNVIGKFGIVQGNGGDLKFGLPLQSVNSSDEVNYHDPLRLSVIIHAPLERVSLILLKNENLKQLLDNQWIYLIVINPEDANSAHTYTNNLNWIELSNEEMQVQTLNHKKERSAQLEQSVL